MTRATAEILAAAAVSAGEQEDYDFQSDAPNHVAAPSSTSKRGALITTATNLIITVIGIGTGVLAARVLGPKGRGELAAIQAWPIALASLGLLGSSEALVYFCAREREQQSAYLSACILIGSCGALVCSIVGFFAMPWLLKAQAPAIIWGARIFLVQIWLYLAIVLPMELLRAARRYLSWNVFRVCPMVLWGAILVVAWIAGVRHPLPLVVASVILSWITLLALVPMVRSEVPRLTLPSRAQVADVFRFGLPVVGSCVPRLVNLRLDQILMAGLMPPVVLGQYVVAVAWSGAGTPFIHGLSAVLVPDLAGRNNVTSQGEALGRISRIAFLIAILLTAGLFATASLGIPFFFGPRFRPAIHAAQILALAGGAAGFNLILSEGVRGLGRPVAALRAEILGLIITVIGLWLLLGPFGILGAAFVSLAAYFSTTLWLLAETRVATGVSIADLTVPRPRDVRLLADHLRQTAKTLLRRRFAVARAVHRLPRSENTDVRSG